MKPNEIIPFNYEGSTVRTVDGNDGDTWFVAADVAKILGYRDAFNMTRRLDDDEKGTRSVSTPGGEQHLAIINEAGLYTAIIGSKVEGAKAFKRWVTHEVLPTIRRQGGYINPNADEHQLNAIVRRAQMHMELLQAARGLIDSKHLEAKARVELARGLGELPQLDPNDRPLYTQDFLKTKNLSKSRLRSVAGTFGKRVKAAYTLEHGREPGKYLLNLPNGQTRDVYAYTEKDRPLMDRIWDTYYNKEVA
ncbi:Bro-N domain-containing protein [Trueperella pyogenes]|uniref:BRO-N domain-containing protein n=1 Tax=Trueperella pyogenes TaxID=1661 RepID=UPI00312B7B85